VSTQCPQGRLCLKAVACRRMGCRGWVPSVLHRHITDKLCVWLKIKIFLPYFCPKRWNSQPDILMFFVVYLTTQNLLRSSVDGRGLIIDVEGRPSDLYGSYPGICPENLKKTMNNLIQFRRSPYTFEDNIPANKTTASQQHCPAHSGIFTDWALSGSSLSHKSGVSVGIRIVKLLNRSHTNCALMKLEI